MSTAHTACPDTYKGRPALRIETGALTAHFLPEDGGKLASLTAPDGFEFLCQNPAPAYARLAYDGSYIDSECASWDDMFPTIDPYTPPTGRYAGLTLPDHGEVCRLPMEVGTAEGADGAPDGIAFRTDSRLFPLSFCKEVRTETDGALALTYTLTNRGDVPFPCLWAAHCMLRGQDDLRIRTPFAPDAPVEYMFGATPADAFPRDRLTGYAPGTGAAYKFYYTQPTPEGWLGGVYTASGHRFTLDYRADAGAVPYVGIWLNNGAFREYYNIALECCTAPYDAPDKAEAHGYRASLPPHGTLRFTLRVRVE